MSEESTQSEPFNFPFWVLDESDESDEPGAIGRVGSFHLQSMIGRGGMGGVFKAWDEELRRIVAVKFIRQDLINDEYRTRFIREARAAAAVTHPNIVAVHRIEECKGSPFIVMEYVEGKSLQQLIDRNTCFQPVQLLQMILQLAEGLQAAHDRGVVHRDIKPSNVLIEEGSDRVKITDFGLARFTSKDQMLESIPEDGPLGTPAFMSPEQVNGERADVRSDLFSLGCLIYAVVDRHSPFQGNHFADTATRILTKSPPLLSSVHPQIPVVVSKLVSRLLEKDPADRCQSADEVAYSIRSVLQEMNRGAELPVTETIALDYPSRRRRRRRLITSAVAITLLSIGAMGWFLYSNFLSTAPLNTHGQANGKNEAGEMAGKVITVSKDGEGRFQTLKAALTAAKPGDVIRVIDDEIYEVNLSLNKTHNLNNIVIEAVNGAHLVPRTAG
ncbi:MAG: protein kinase, partial [Rhodopirellula sp.]|nr:protein kinase [Rhodopirellula sp.]